MDANCIAQATAHQTRRHRPARPVLFHENIPSELAKLSRWVVWRFEWDSDTGKWDKPPTNPHDPGRHAKPDDPTTWGTCDAAIACYSRDSFDGVGFVAGNGVLCVDIDDCVDPATGDVVPWAQEIIAAADTYAERSPSGRGVRLFAIGDEPQIENQCGRKWYINARGLGADKTPQVEIYRERKYFTVTGDHIEGNPNKVEPWKTATIDVILRHAKQKNSSRRNGAKADPHNGNSANVNGINLSVPPTPAEVIAKARVARNGEKFAALFDHARGGGDHSADDLALCSILAFWCGPHPTLIDEVFRMSALMRDKWDERRGDSTYGVQTIRKALGNCGEFYDWNRVAKQESAIVPSNDDRHSPPDVFANPWILTQAGRTDLANARRFAKAHGANVRWIDVWGQWFVWDGRRWKLDDECRITELARATASDLWREVERAEGWLQANVHDDRERERTKAGLNAFARSSSSAPGVRHFLTLAQGEQGIAINHERLDRHEWLFNVANGTIDLRTGKLVPHNREHLLTKLNMVAYDFDARCPLWRKFIKEVCESDDDLASYLQRLVGYCLTGSTRDHVLPFLHGTGANGKSVFCSVVAAMLGDGYAMRAAPELLMARTGEQHPTERADLFGKRLVITNEIDSGRRLNEALVKDLTGGDKIRARRMREDFWEFEPTHKVWMVGNHKPRIEGTDNGIWRRVKLIPFTRVFSESEQDKDLPRKLLAELPGILNWAIDGCLSWQRDGLGEPAAVASATSEYRSEQDIVGAFISECCIVNPGISSRASELYAAYREWAEKTGDRALNNREFGSELGKRFERFTSNGACYRSVGLRATEGFE